METKKNHHLTLKKQWFDMINGGDKKEEYRAIKPYWIKRFCKQWIERDLYVDCINNLCEECIISKLFECGKYDIVHFRNGYSKTAPEMYFELNNIVIGKGNKEWGAPQENVFILKLGKRINNG